MVLRVIPNTIIGKHFLTSYGDSGMILYKYISVRPLISIFQVAIVSSSKKNISIPLLYICNYYSLLATLFARFAKMENDFKTLLEPEGLKYRLLAPVYSHKSFLDG